MLEMAPWAEAPDVMHMMGCTKDGMVEERRELVELTWQKSRALDTKNRTGSCRYKVMGKYITQIGKDSGNTAGMRTV
jgi:hypothetical protein